ncbi:MAG TPA: arsenate reductase ArsC [Nocardioidaceae bacterium]|nr:arsenate reductase ArsC [Nocardioidaceae bacterium]
MPDSTPNLLDARHALSRVTDELARSFAEHFSPETVAEVVDESYRLLADKATIRTHLVPLSARFARDRLDSLAKSEGLVENPTPQVLFVCVHNAGRSQMAAALLAQKAQGRVTVRSAGSAPASDVHPTVLAVMAEAGLDLGTAFPKPLTDETVRAADVVVTMGCGDACPVYSGKRYLNWELSDPAGTDAGGVRALRDEIDRHVTDLLRSLDIPT